MNQEDKLNLMMTRFVHKDSAYAIQKFFAKDTGTKKAGTHYFRETQGECKHHPPCVEKKTCSYIRDKIYTNAQLIEHLTFKHTYAPYQTSKEGMIKWVCIDIDAYDNADEAEVKQCVLNVAKKCNAFFGKGHILVEHSGSKGYHIWIFFDGLVEVGYGYTLGRMVTDDVKPPEDTNIEVYPKHEHHREGFFGATVKTPLGIHQKNGVKCVFVNAAFIPYEDQWNTLDKVVPLSVQWIHANVKPRPAEKASRFTPQQWTPLCLARLMEDGAPEGLRDEVTFKLACYFRNKGIPEDLALVSLLRWNRLNHPPLDEQAIHTKVEQGYRSDYSFLPCGDHRLDKHCHSQCSFFDKKVEKRWFKKTSPIGTLSVD